MNLNIFIIREFKQRQQRRQRERQKSNRFRLIDTEQKLCTCITLFWKFLCRCNIAFENIRFSVSLRRWGRFARRNARKVPSGEERGETDVFAGYCSTTRTWKCLISRLVQDVNTRQRLSFSFSWTLILSFRIQLQKNLPTFYELTRWNKRDKVWSSANSLFKWRFRCRRRRCCLSALLYVPRLSLNWYELFFWPHNTPLLLQLKDLDTFQQPKVKNNKWNLLCGWVMERDFNWKFLVNFTCRLCTAFPSLLEKTFPLFFTWGERAAILRLL